jgi:hypothetical protein
MIVRSLTLELEQRGISRREFLGSTAAVLGLPDEAGRAIAEAIANEAKPVLGLTWISSSRRQLAMRGPPDDRAGVGPLASLGQDVVSTPTLRVACSPPS